MRYRGTMGRGQCTCGPGWLCRRWWWRHPGRVRGWGWGGHESRVGAAAWKLVLPNVFRYNTSFAFNFARLHPFWFLFPPVLYLLCLTGCRDEGLVVVLWTDETSQRCFLKPGTSTWLQITIFCFPRKTRRGNLVIIYSTLVRDLKENTQCTSDF